MNARSSSLGRPVLVLSPHLDDAALSCADHLLKWLAQGDRVTCLTLFTKFRPLSSAPISAYQQPFLAAQGFSSALALEEARLKEDVTAMRYLGLPYEHLGFTDAGFRTEEGRALYQSYRELTPWKVDDASRSLYESVVESLRSWKDASSPKSQRVVLPLGVGGHVDHWITKQAAEEVWPASQRLYYLDFPYALRPWKYRLPAVKALLTSQRSTLPMSAKKRACLDLYQSQMPYLFRRPPSYREVLLTPPETRETRVTP